MIGNWTKSPELRYTPGNGTAVVTATLAVNQKFKDKDETLFVNVVIWGKTAENVAQYTDKGSKVYISGRLVIRSYEGNDGQKRWVTEINADRVLFLDSKRTQEADTYIPDDSDAPF
ncbi:MAG: single-stranded DNA-binding protein [Candidatus Aenigmarchaeota archaeon]|nr:single-stranded DNA-binding protein [Candidatus Aenigmarchaeota archaeon]